MREARVMRLVFTKYAVFFFPLIGSIKIQPGKKKFGSIIKRTKSLIMSDSFILYGKDSGDFQTF